MLLDAAVSDAASRDALLVKVVRFSRIARLILSGSSGSLWTEATMLQLISAPGLQRAETLSCFPHGSPPAQSPWLRSERAQTALFALPRLREIMIKLAPGERLCKSAVTQARALTDAIIADNSDPHSIRALASAPNLTRLQLTGNGTGPDPCRKLILCLPPSLQSLDLRFDTNVTVLPRPALKALFQRMPLLQSLRTSLARAPLLQGMLDAGVLFLAMLRRVELIRFDPESISRDLLRRFLHRFPQVHVGLTAQSPDQFDDAWRRFGEWPRVQVKPLSWPEGPPSPHASDDESGCDVEALADHDEDDHES